MLHCAIVDFTYHRPDTMDFQVFSDVAPGKENAPKMMLANKAVVSPYNFILIYIKSTSKTIVQRVLRLFIIITRILAKIKSSLYLLFLCG